MEWRYKDLNSFKNDSLEALKMEALLLECGKNKLDLYREEVKYFIHAIENYRKRENLYCEYNVNGFCTFSAFCNRICDTQLCPKKKDAPGIFRSHTLLDLVIP